MKTFIFAAALAITAAVGIAQAQQQQCTTVCERTGGSMYGGGGGGQSCRTVCY